MFRGDESIFFLLITILQSLLVRRQVYIELRCIDLEIIDRHLFGIHERVLMLLVIGGNLFLADLVIGQLRLGQGDVADVTQLPAQAQVIVDLLVGHEGAGGNPERKLAGCQILGHSLVEPFRRHALGRQPGAIKRGIKTAVALECRNLRNFIAQSFCGNGDTEFLVGNEQYLLVDQLIEDASLYRGLLEEPCVDRTIGSLQLLLTELVKTRTEILLAYFLVTNFRNIVIRLRNEI